MPGSRNDKRWQDVEELLDAGIDVLTTVNIQHLESLNDVVEQITGVPQRETVPDAVVRAADQVELVDMTPEALRRRMAHGNIYRPEKIDAALGNYFRVGNLTALRELALLWLADKVDDQLDQYRGRPPDRRHLGDPGAGRRRADRRPRGRDPDPPGRPDRRPRPRAPTCWPCTSPAPTAWPAPTRPMLARQRRPGREPRRHLPPGRRRRRAAARCWTSPGRSTPPSSCSARPAAAGSPSCSPAGVGVTTTALSGDDRRAPGHPRTGRAGPAHAGGCRPRCPARRRLAGFGAGRRWACRC